MRRAIAMAWLLSSILSGQSRHVEAVVPKSINQWITRAPGSTITELPSGKLFVPLDMKERTGLGSVQDRHFHILHPDGKFDTAIYFTSAGGNYINFFTYSYIMDSSVIAYINPDGDNWGFTGRVLLVDTAGNIIKQLTVGYRMMFTNLIPYDSMRFITVHSYGANSYSLFILAILDTAINCYKRWSVNMSYNYRVAVYQESVDSAFLAIMGASGASPFNGGVNLGYIKMDTSAMQAITFWYKHPSYTEMFPAFRFIKFSDRLLVHGARCGYNDAPLVLYAIDNNGNVKWVRTFSGISADVPKLYKIDSSTFACVGLFSNPSIFGGQDGYIILMDTAGNLLKAIAIGSTGSDQVSALHRFSDGSFLIGASTDFFTISGSRSPVYIKADPNLQFSCGGLHWKDITSLLDTMIDTTAFIDTFITYTLANHTCASYDNGQRVSVTSSADSSFLWWDSVYTKVDTIIPAVCNGDSGMVVLSTVGGASPYVFIWSTGSVDTIDVDTALLQAGSYTVFVEDVTGCRSDTDTIAIMEPLPVSVIVDSLTNIRCYGDSNGLIVVSAVGGNGGYLYVWNTGDSSNSLRDAPAGTYIVTVTDSLGCVGTDTIAITEPLPVSVIVDSLTNIRCYGDSNGLIVVSAVGGNGGYSYVWNTGDSSNSLRDVPAGTYIVTVTDSLGCVGTDTITISQPTKLTVSIDTVNKPLLVANASGGTTPYAYQWNTGSNTDTTTASATGSYWVQVTDSNGCVASDTVFVTIKVNEVIKIDNSDCNIRVIGENLNIFCEESIEKAVIISFDGKIVQKSRSSGKFVEITLPNRNNEPYFIILETAHGKQIYKITIVN